MVDTSETVTFSDLMTDKDGNYAKEQYIALAQQLTNDGYRKDRIIYSLVDAAFDMAADSGVCDFGDFIDWFAEHSAETKTKFDDSIKSLNNEIDKELH